MSPALLRQVGPPTLLAGLLANISWNYAFLIYLLGLIAVILVLMYLPNERLKGGSGPSLGLLKRFHPSVVGRCILGQNKNIQPQSN